MKLQTIKILFLLISINISWACLDDILDLARAYENRNPVWASFLHNTEMKPARRAALEALLPAIEVHPNHQDFLPDIIDFSAGLTGGSFAVLKRQLERGALAGPEVRTIQSVLNAGVNPLRKLIRIRGKVARYKTKAEGKLQKEIDRLDPNDPVRLQKVRALHRQWENKVRFYHDAQMACKKSRTKTAFDRATQQFARYSIPLGLASPAFMYPIVNSTREKDGRWWGQYGYDLSFIAVQNFGFYAVVLPFMMRRNLGLISSTVASFGYYNAVNYLGIQTVYNPLFGLDEDDAREVFQSIESQDFQDEFRRLVMDAQNEELVRDIIKEINTSFEYYPEFEDFLNSDAFAENINKEIFEDDRLQDLLFQMIIEDLYRKQNGDLFDSGGDVGADKFKAEVIVDAVSTPIDVAASIYIMNMVCNGMTSVHGMRNALAAYFAWSLTYNAGLFGFRLYGSGF